MLHTVTLSPGFDDYFTVSEFTWGGVGRMQAFRSDPSGKGVSCARTAVALGLPVKAHVLMAADDAAAYEAKLDSEEIGHRLVCVPGPVRHNLTLVDGTGEHVAAHFMGERLAVAPEQLGVVEELGDGLLAEVAAGDVVTLNGSLAQGLGAETWAGIARRALATGAQVVVDAQGAALQAALEVRGVTAFKPNDDEVAALPGLADLPREERVAEGLRRLAASGVTIPLISLGSDGVALLRGGHVERWECPVDNPVVSVMAGDAFVAGMSWGLLQGLEGDNVVAHGLAAAAAHVAGLRGDALGARARENLSLVRRAA